MWGFEKKLYSQLRLEKCCSICLWLGCLRSSVILLGSVIYSQGIADALMDMYQNMGDALALQYGGSSAHNNVFP